ncbi:HlyD family type I secretion periplasmic adaptor subunit [Roseibium aggregatum]|uniref:Membrane fusion protein (MFP) family protein n=1 Tax=Roseibium aggregatum TaxID=187304 RepID=A0A926NQX7_9HYPH|nr:HlyD family type I secretion periplasmic adaptor subunit [Roseibium aggregatum]MBD1545727.1 HlyD family type I secretion periplasmic adaptor subunit [Roseibium aggregatum]
MPDTYKKAGRPVSDDVLRRAIRRHLLIAAFAALIVVGGIGGWAAIAEISGAVVTPATVVVQSNVKHVQHQEGGIVKEILVKDDDLVSAGDLLIRLDDTITRANLGAISKQLGELKAQEARLLAERDGRQRIAFSDDDIPDDIKRGQQLLLEARQASIAGRKDQLQEQIRQFNKQAEGLKAQLEAKESEIELIDEELADLDALLKKQLVSKSRVSAQRRERARLQGQYGSFVSEIARIQEGISERKIQILQIEETYRAELLENLHETRSQIAQLEEQKIAAQDKLTRIDIRAPQDGYVHELAVHTIGGVVTPGEVLMSIVPRADRLVIEAKVKPVDIDELTPGQEATVRFPSFDRRTTPELKAKLLSVSADLTMDQRTGTGYYTARLTIDDAELALLEGKVLVPGMPVEVFMKTQDRTVLSYLIKPVSDQIAHAMREH